MDAPCSRTKSLIYQSSVIRWALIGFGWVCVGTGVIGIFVPGLPTTVFLIMAAWAFSRGSDRAHRWLINHPRLGQLIHHWNEHRVIPPRAKICAILMMTISYGYVIYSSSDGSVFPIILAMVMVPAALYITTRANRIPEKSIIQTDGKSKY